MGSTSSVNTTTINFLSGTVEVQADSFNTEKLLKTIESRLGELGDETQAQSSYLKLGPNEAFAKITYFGDTVQEVRCVSDGPSTGCSVSGLDIPQSEAPSAHSQKIGPAKLIEKFEEIRLGEIGRNSIFFGALHGWAASLL